MKKKPEGFQGERIFQFPTEVIESSRNQGWGNQPYLKAIGHFPNAYNHGIERSIGVDEYIFIYNVGGRGELELPSGSFSIEEHEACFIFPNVPHSYGALPESAWNIYWFHFQGAQVKSYLQGIDVTEAQPIIYLPNQTALLDAFENIWKWTYSDLTPSAVMAQNTALAHMLALIHYYKRSKKTSRRRLEERMLDVIVFMQENVRENLTLSDIAQQANLSIPQCSAVFNQQLGSSPLKYFTRLRIQKACELLNDKGRYSVQEIANQMGYSDPFYFCRVFKKVMGVSPRTYRGLH